MKKSRAVRNETLYSRMSKRLHRGIAASFLGRIFTSYDGCNAAFSSVFYKKKQQKRTYQKQQKSSFRSSVAYAMEHNIFSRLYRKTLSGLLATGVRSFGVFLLSMGLCFVSLYLATLFGFESALLQWYHLFVGALLCGVGIVLLFPDLSLGAMLCEGAFLRVLLSGVFGISDELPREAPQKGKQRFLLSVLLALLVAGLGLFINPIYIVFAVLLLFVAAMVLSLPEAGLVLTVFFLPFSKLIFGSDILTVVLLLLSLFSYLLKYLRGNRAFHLELQDFVLVLLSFLLAISFCTLSEQSISTQILLALLFLGGYFLVVNIIATPRWMRRCRFALIASASIVSVISILRFVFAAAKLSYLTPERFYLIGGEAVVGFSGRVPFSFYLAVAFAFALPSIAFAKKRNRPGLVIATLLILSALVLTGVSAALFAAMLTLILFFLIYDSKSLPLLLLLGAVIVIGLYILPPAVRDSVSLLLHDFHYGAYASDGFLANQTTVKILFEGPFGAVAPIFGLGFAGLSRVYAYVAPLGSVFAAENFSLYLFVFCELGVLGILLLLLFLFLFLQNAFTCLAGERGERKNHFPYIGVCLAASVFLFFLFRNPFEDCAALGIFSLSVALVSAAMRYRRRQRIVVDGEPLDGSRGALDYRMRKSGKVRKLGKSG